MRPPQNVKSADDFQTPKIGIEPLIKYLDKKWIIWECACGKGNLVTAFKEQGFKVIGSDISMGVNFLTQRPETFDCIITNPPYSIKQQFLERCYFLGKPFALLLPLTTFETQKRQALFKKFGLEVIFLDRCINFQTPSGKGSGAWFATAWFTSGLNIGRQLTFEHLPKI